MGRDEDKGVEEWTRGIGEGRRTAHLMAATKQPRTSIDKSGQFIFQWQHVSTLKK